MLTKNPYTARLFYMTSASNRLAERGLVGYYIIKITVTL
jgi:hypothetical protein